LSRAIILDLEAADAILEDDGGDTPVLVGATGLPWLRRGTVIIDEFKVEVPIAANVPDIDILSRDVGNRVGCRLHDNWDHLIFDGLKKGDDLFKVGTVGMS
jgi:hypothetical protein